MTSSLLISLDFELFWGVSESRTINGYRGNIEGVWEVVPKLLDLFRRYEIRATWATVGMLMCRDYTQWRALRPRVLPSYANPRCSTYNLDSLVRDNPQLFFARPLVEKILAADGQELASHTYSHFFCDEAGVTIEQFQADCECQLEIFAEYGVVPSSLVLPRNQVRQEFLRVAHNSGITAYRGNPDHWLYRDGHFVRYGKLGRIIRKLDSLVPISGRNISHVTQDYLEAPQKNVPASFFLRPAEDISFLDNLHLGRIKRGMRYAALNGGIFHLWWHPHNFGGNIQRNLDNLESLFRHFVELREKYGMTSIAMTDFMKTGDK